MSRAFTGTKTKAPLTSCPVRLRGSVHCKERAKFKARRAEAMHSKLSNEMNKKFEGPGCRNGSSGTPGACGDEAPGDVSGKNRTTSDDTSEHRSMTPPLTALWTSPLTPSLTPPWTSPTTDIQQLIRRHTGSSDPDSGVRRDRRRGHRTAPAPFPPDPKMDKPGASLEGLLALWSANSERNYGISAYHKEMLPGKTPVVGLRAAAPSQV